MKKRIIAFLLTLTMLVSVCAVTASAAREEEFISEVALVYEDSVAEARQAIEGTDWKLFEYDLNPNADYMIDDGVYLIYKTSTNVEDAITDLRVMDMYGGFNISDYERQLENSREGYLKMMSDLRTVAAEFKDAYEADNEMALLAHRQMNYYVDEQTAGGTETGMKMGDFFLNLPSDDKIVQVLFEGNSIVVSNLISLLAIGTSGEAEKSLVEKVEQMYAIKDTFDYREYYDDAKLVANALASLQPKVMRYYRLLGEYNMKDGNVEEEEFQFINEYAAIVALMENVKIGTTSIADMVRRSVFTIEELYPLAAALTDGQKALIKMGQIETVLKFAGSNKPIQEMKELIDEAEAEMKDENGVLVPISAYVGVDRSIFRGAFAMTTEAERQQALTGETWDINKAADSSGLLIASYVISGLGAVAAGPFLALGSVAVYYKTLSVVTALLFRNTIGMAIMKGGTNFWGSVCSYYMASWGPSIQFFGVISGGLILIAAGMAGIALWYNYYNPDYLEIPSTMIDVCETDIGDKYVKYSAAKVFGEEDMNADFNAYEGKEWNALYYTKDATAGNALTPKLVYSDNNSSVARRHQGISKFGETKAFNLNSNVYNDDAPGVYVTIRYSTTKKAGADVPSVIGSILGQGGLYAVTGIVGAVIGCGAMAAIDYTKKKKRAKAEGATDANAN